MKVVLDANVFVSALIVKGGNQNKIIHHEKSYVIITSEEILQEVNKVLHYERIQKRYNVSNQAIRTYLHRLRKDCLVRIHPAVKVVDEDPTDNKYIACAKQVRADYIVSGDPHLTKLKEYRGIRIVTPAQFLEVLHG